MCSEHVQTEHASTCTICDQQFNNKRNLDAHIEENHNNSATNICTICDQRFENMESSTQH